MKGTPFAEVRLAKWRGRLLQTLLTVASLRARRMSWWI